ncbi:MAG: ArnT family glycosyltransferase [Holophagaceae bacterium]
MEPHKYLPGEKLGQWIRSNRWPIFFSILYLTLIPLRDFWSPDEPDFAQAVREMIARNEWIFPYFNGLIYTEKPILFYWLMKVSNWFIQVINGTSVEIHFLTPWALRLPSVLSSILFFFFLKRWTKRFLSEQLSHRTVMILGVFPLWIWQAQFIQIDMLFAVLLASSWMYWIGGYLLENGLASYQKDNETSFMYRRFVIFLALATLTKGPLAAVMTIAILPLFLFTQRGNYQLKEFHVLKLLTLFLAIVLPWYCVAIYQAGLSYGYYLIIYQNIERALRAWDHIQPWWKYFEYTLGDLFPWSILLIPSFFTIYKNKENRNPLMIFIALCIIVPFGILSISQSKQGKYLLMSFPFAALIVAGFLGEVASKTRKSLKWLIHFAFVITPLILCVVFLTLVLHTHGVIPMPHLISVYYEPASRTLLHALLLITSLGTFAVVYRLMTKDFLAASKELCVTLSLIFVTAAHFGFPILDATKNFKKWGNETRPLINGRATYFWRTVRGGALLYNEQSMPEIHSYDRAFKIGQGDFLVAMASDWTAIKDNSEGSSLYDAFYIIKRVQAGSDTLLLLERK